MLVLGIRLPWRGSKSNCMPLLLDNCSVVSQEPRLQSTLGMTLNDIYGAISVGIGKCWFSRSLKRGKPELFIFEKASSLPNQRCFTTRT